MDELNNLALIPRCTCVSTTCICKHTQKLTKYKKMMKLSQFIMRHNEQFTSIRGQIMLRNPLPDINHVYAMLL